MATDLKLNDPWLVAVWPGMGHVAINAGVYMLAKLQMSLIAELDTGDLFDLDHVEVKNGLIKPPHRPRSRFFVWTDPNKKHDFVLFLGEAQPPLGRLAYCRQLIDYAKKLGVARVFTFAAMATQMHPERPSKTFGAATDEAGVEELRRLELTILEEGNIGGLNGVLLGVAAEAGLRGACMLGEMPHIFAQLPFPKASLAILEAFTTVAGIELEFTELAEQARSVERQLGEMLARVEESFRQQAQGDEESQLAAPPDEPGLGAADTERLESLFREAANDRTKAFELKQELDRLGVFKDYEDRFLDLFKQRE